MKTASVWASFCGYLGHCKASNLGKCCRLKKAEKDKMKEMAAAAEVQDKEARRKARKCACCLQLPLVCRCWAVRSAAAGPAAADCASAAAPQGFAIALGHTRAAAAMAPCGCLDQPAAPEWRNSACTTGLASQKLLQHCLASLLRSKRSASAASGGWGAQRLVTMTAQRGPRARVLCRERKERKEREQKGEAPGNEDNGDEEGGEEEDAGEDGVVWATDTSGGLLITVRFLGLSLGPAMSARRAMGEKVHHMLARVVLAGLLTYWRGASEEWGFWGGGGGELTGKRVPLCSFCPAGKGAGAADGRHGRAGH